MIRTCIVYMTTAETGTKDQISDAIAYKSICAFDGCQRKILKGYEKVFMLIL